MLLKQGQRWAWRLTDDSCNFLSPWCSMSVSVGGFRFDSMCAWWGIHLTWGANPRRVKHVEFRSRVVWERIERLQGGF